MKPIVLVMFEPTVYCYRSNAPPLEELLIGKRGLRIICEQTFIKLNNSCCGKATSMHIFLKIGRPRSIAAPLMLSLIIPMSTSFFYPFL